MSRSLGALFALLVLVLFVEIDAFLTGTFGTRIPAINLFRSKMTVNCKGRDGIGNGDIEGNFLSKKYGRELEKTVYEKHRPHTNALTEAVGGMLLRPRAGGEVEITSPTSIDTIFSTAEMKELIRDEYEKIFWVTGFMNTSLWETNCTFADPFSSFGGEGSTQRFKRNADSLGSMVMDAKIKITACEVEKMALTLSESKDWVDCDVVKVGWIFSSKLKLPWRPILSAAGETYHYLCPKSGRIRRYEERWKSKPMDVVLRLFKPTTPSY